AGQGITAECPRREGSRIRERRRIQIWILRTRRQAVRSDGPVRRHCLVVRQDLVGSLLHRKPDIGLAWSIWGGRRASESYCNRRSALKSLGEHHLPSAQHPVREAPAVAEPAALAVRKFIHHCSDKA